MTSLWRRVTSSWLIIMVVIAACVAEPADDGEQDDRGLPLGVDGRPRGSFNRWSYNDQHKSPTLSPPGADGVRQRLADAPRDSDANNEDTRGDRLTSNEQQYRRWRQSQRLRAYTTTALPTPGRRVELEAKRDVDWAYDTLSFYLRASSDMRFKIRYAPNPGYGSPWPMPRIYHPQPTVYLVDPAQLRLHLVGVESCDILQRNFHRIRHNMFGEAARADGTGNPEDGAGGFPVKLLRVMRWLNVTLLKDCAEFPYLEMDESYDLDIKISGVSIIATEVWGALRAMETLSQLVFEDDAGHFLVNKTLVHDYPRFKHRGVLLDTSRHYLDKETIIENLEAMAQNKMNVFHWHIVDDQSFPYASKVFPNLSRLGAYHPVTHVYTHEVIAEIIEEARIRGIRVIPEFDTPGHTFSWGYGQDHLLTPCYDYRYRPNGLFGPINPILRKTYAFLRRLFQEVLEVFHDRYIHLGGDEVPFDCWQMNPALKNFMRRNNLSDVRDLLNVYEKKGKDGRINVWGQKVKVTAGDCMRAEAYSTRRIKLVDIVTKLGESRNMGAGYIVWQEVFDNNVKVKPDTIVQVWSGDSYNIDHVTRTGFRALFSTCWYLDYINYGQDWDKYYTCEQINMSPTDYRVGNESLLIGGEVCLWTEFADDDSITPRLWPRASAAAERLWSDRSVMNFQEAAPRIEAHRCRMMRRGIRVGVLSGPGYCSKSHHHHRGRTKPLASVVHSGRDGVDGDGKVVPGLGSLGGTNPLVELQQSAAVSTGNVSSSSLSAALWLCPLLILIAVAILLCTLCVVVRRPDLPFHGRIMSTVQRLHIRSLPQLVTIFITFAVVWAVWSAAPTFWTQTTSAPTS